MIYFVVATYYTWANLEKNNGKMRAARSTLSCNWQKICYSTMKQSEFIFNCNEAKSQGGYSPFRVTGMIK